MARPSTRRSLVNFLAQATTNCGELHNVQDLALLARMPVRSFQYRCQSVGVSAKACLDFVRCCGLVICQEPTWDPTALLSSKGLDSRTVRRLLFAGGLDLYQRTSIAEFIERQTFMTDPELRTELQSMLQSLASGPNRNAAVVRRLDSGVQVKQASAAVLKDC